MHTAPAIVVGPPDGKPPNRVEAEKHISYALTASPVDPVQDRACALELVEFPPKTLPVMSYLHGAMGPCRSSQTMASRRIGQSVLKIDSARNRTWNPSRRSRYGLGYPSGLAPCDDFFSTPADPSKLCWMCPPYHRCSDCVQKIGQEKLRAIVVGPNLVTREVAEVPYGIYFAGVPSSLVGD